MVQKLVLVILCFATLSAKAQNEWQIDGSFGNRRIPIIPEKIDSDLKPIHSYLPSQYNLSVKMLGRNEQWIKGHVLQLSVGHQLDRYQIVHAIPGDDLMYTVKRSLWSYALSYGYQWEYFPNRKQPTANDKTGTSLLLLPQLELRMIDNPGLDIEYKGFTIREDNKLVLTVPLSCYFAVQHRIQTKENGPIFHLNAGLEYVASYYDNTLNTGFNYRIGLGVSLPY